MTATIAVTVVLTGVVTAHVVVLRVRGWKTGAGSSLFEAAVFGVLAFIGSCGVWMLVGSVVADERSPRLFRMGAAALYVAGLIVYLEIRSLLSRGYSLRILVDLRRVGGTCTVESLKSTYGGGKGIEGLLRKRIASLERLRLLRADPEEIGPVTAPGRLCAITAVWVRRLLRLDTVG